MSKKKTAPRPAAAGASRPQAASPNALLVLAQRQINQRQFAQALQSCEQALQAQPNHAGAWRMLGIAHVMQGQPAQALAAYQKAHALEPRNTQTLCLMAVASAEQGQLAQAIGFFDQALALQPQQANIWFDRGLVLHNHGQHEQALQSLAQALQAEPRHKHAWMARGDALRALGRHHEALASHERALALDERDADLWVTVATTLEMLARPQDALACYEKALAIDARHITALHQMGSALVKVNAVGAGIEKLEAACRLAPDEPLLLMKLSEALQKLPHRLEDAMEMAEHAHRLRPDSAGIAALLLNMRLQSVKWDGLDALQDTAMQQLAGDMPPGSGDSASAFFALSWPAITAQGALRMAHAAQPAPTDNAISASASTAQPHAAAAAHTATAQATPARRLRVGYLSSDLRDHAVGRLMAGVLESHDKNLVQTLAFHSWPQADASPFGQRVRAAVDSFIDIHALTDAQAADLVRRHRIDILIDLSGHTLHSRPALVQMRPAPVQVGYLGFPSTCGLDAVDYIIGDRWVTPEGCAADFSERIVRLPDSFQANDSRREHPENTPARAALGLPEGAFVFCCFNNTYKINPPMFGIWMRLLAQTPNSVLWLLAESAAIEARLRQEAKARGIDPARLVFAPRAEYGPYLARYRAADLFLDTQPFNAGTTASDALWMGLPLLTCRGATFAGRMGASLLHNTGLPELVADDLHGYEALALQLAHDAPRLRALRQRLQDGRSGAPLFDTRRFARHLECALQMMWQRHAQGLPPAEINVPALPAQD